MLALFNFNTYLGGGETLFVRMAEFFQKKGVPVLLFFHKESYIERDLERLGITQQYCCPIDGDINYYYLKIRDRIALIDKLLSYFDVSESYDLLSFCARDLFMVSDLSKQLKHVKVSHLVLHPQDHLYACQSIINKLLEEYGGARRFGRKDMIANNVSLFNEVAAKGALIPMTEVSARVWREKYYINIESEDVVPLPTSEFPDYNFHPINNKKILWIGRIVNFKIPALLVVLNFLKRHSDYSLTIIGYGAEKLIHDYMKDHGIQDGQVIFMGKVAYAQLGEVIKKHSIGYAMGTSIIEIARYGIPVIMALSNLSFNYFRRDICGDVFYHASKGDVGTAYNISGKEEDFPIIDEVIQRIEENYEAEAMATYQYVRENYSLTQGINHYLSLIKDKGKGGCIQHHIPSSGVIRRALFNIMSK